MICIPTELEFWARTAILVDYEFEDVDLEPDSIAGIFDNHRLPELTEYCKNNPDYHIISIVKGCLLFNKVMPNATSYRLGQGDSNPDLVCFEAYRVGQVIDARIAALAKVDT